LDFGGASSALITLTTNWTEYSASRTAASWSMAFIIRTDFPVNKGNQNIQIWHPQTENVTGQSIQAPGEYVSVGVLSGPPYTQPNMYGGPSQNSVDGV